MMRIRRHGQITMEAAFLTAVVAAGLFAMGTYVRRSIQANLKGLEEQVNVEAKRTQGP